MIKIQKFMNNYVVSGLDSHADAEEIKADMLSVLHDYGKVTLADMYDLAGLNAPNHTYNRHGWTDMGTIEKNTIIEFNPGEEDRGWYIIFPTISYVRVNYVSPSYRYSQGHDCATDPVKPCKSPKSSEPHSIHITIDTDAFDNDNTSLGEIFQYIYTIQDRDVFVSII